MGVSYSSPVKTVVRKELQSKYKVRQGRGMDLLLNLTDRNSEVCQEVVRTPGCVDTLLKYSRAMDPAFKKRAVLLMMQLTSPSHAKQYAEQHQEIFIRSGLVQECVRVLHEGDAELKTAAAMALKSLACCRQVCLAGRHPQPVSTAFQLVP